MSIKITNESLLAAKYQILPQDQQSKLLALAITDDIEGIIPPNKSIDVNITLQTQKTGIIRIPLHVKIIGTNIAPYTINLIATSVGPSVEVSQAE